MQEINMHCCAILENKAWFVTADNHFMWMDIKTGETHYVMPEGNRIFNAVVDPMIATEREIFWAEQNGKRFLSYNLDTKTCKTYEMNNIDMQNWSSFSLIERWKETIILVPKHTDKILFFDILKNCFTEVKDIFGQYIIKSDDGYIDYSFIVDDSLYLFLTDNQTVLKYSLETAKICTVDRRDLKQKIVSAYRHGDVLYVLDAEGNILIVDKNFQLLKDCITVNKKYMGYSKLFVINNKLVVLPSDKEDISVINLEDGKEEQVITPDDFSYKDIQWGKYVGYTEQDNYILIPNRKSNYIMILGKNNFCFRWIKPCIPGNKEEVQYVQSIGKNFFEEDNLELFIEYICLSKSI